MADVFISYAREDRARADQIARGLAAMGLQVFWDSDIPPGKTWADYIEEKLSQCKAMVVLWSAESTKSQWVREEARMGRDKGVLIPVMIDGSPAPFGFGEVQAANLSAWRGEANNPDWVRFCNAVNTAVNGPGAVLRQAPHAPVMNAASPSYAVDAPVALSPFGYVFKCLRMSFNGAGRARRLEYGWFTLFQFVAFVITLMIDGSLTGFNAYTSQPNAYVTTWLLLAFVPAAIGVTSRRSHDLGWSGWLAAAAIIPYIGWVLILVFLFMPGKAAENKHGPSPKAA